MRDLSIAAATWQVRVALVLAVAAGLLLTRWPLSSRYLLYFDSVNFALALEKFDPFYHQPQPPGYPLFVGLSRVVHWFVPRAEDALFLTGIAGATASTGRYSASPCIDITASAGTMTGVNP